MTRPPEREETGLAAHIKFSCTDLPDQCAATGPQNSPNPRSSLRVAHGPGPEHPIGAPCTIGHIEKTAPPTARRLHRGAFRDLGRQVRSTGGG
jgi:hypothetical protein